jgi:hypothetical protein
MTRYIGLAALPLLSVLVSGTAHAEAIESGTFALGAERLTGMFHADDKVGDTPSRGTTTLALLGNGGDFGTASQAFLLPRVGLDGFIIDGLSLGGNLIVWHTSNDGGSATSFIIEPRIGFAYMFGRVVGIWPRGGFGYWNFSTSPNQGPGPNPGRDAHCFAFTVDVPLIIRPVRSFAITVGPVLDIGFGGKQTVNNNPSQDVSFTQFGLSVGMVAFL